MSIIISSFFIFKHTYHPYLSYPHSSFLTLSPALSVSLPQYKQTNEQKPQCKNMGNC